MGIKVEGCLLPNPDIRDDGGPDWGASCFSGSIEILLSTSQSPEEKGLIVFGSGFSGYICEQSACPGHVITDDINNNI